MLSEGPLVEVDVEKEKDTLDIKPMMQEIEECIVLEEDPKTYAMAGIELVPVPAPVPEQARIEPTIRQAMASVPTVNGTTVKFGRILNGGGRLNGGARYHNARAFENQRRFVKCVMSSTVA
jgi:hypothetical protein